MNLLAIWQKETRNYFGSPLAYLVAGLFWLIAGFYLVGMLSGEVGLIQQVSNGDRGNSIAEQIDVAYIFVNSFFAVLGSLCLFFLPLLSMGLYSKEKQANQLIFVATSPIANWIIALGKLLGVVTFFLFLITPFVLYEIIIFSATKPPIKAMISLLAYGGLILLATAILAWGMFIATLSDRNLVTAILTFGVVIFFWILDIFARNIGGNFGNILQHLSLLRSYSTLIQGVFKLSDLVLLLSYILLGVFLTTQSIEILHSARK